jgi:hypothetical protein
MSDRGQLLYHEPLCVGIIKRFPFNPLLLIFPLRDTRCGGLVGGHSSETSV